MFKFFIFFLLWRILGNPFVALLVLLVILYFIDRRYVGLLPNLFRPFQVGRRISKLKQQLQLSPHDTSAKVELAHLLIEKKRYAEALPYLEQALPVMNESPEVLYETGLCRLKLGDLQQGEALILDSVKLNERVRYGEPYLRLAEALAKTDIARALDYLEKFRAIQSSSCEAYYRLGQLYEQLGRATEAAGAYQECVQVYRMLPKYKRRSERRWWLLSLMKKRG